MHCSYLGCGYTYNRFEGTITSPNYPSDYLDNTKCENFIHVGFNKTIRITFKDFKTESGSDHLSFFDYGNGKYEQAKTFSGDVLPESFTSTSNKMKIIFTTDHSIQYRGFELTYTEG